MKTIIVLAMHGAPPGDSPGQELAEFFRLHSLVEQKGTDAPESEQARYASLEAKMRNWPRNEHNDPFYTASQELAARLGEVSGYEVIVGYNEFCAPSIDEALQSAVDNGATKIIVATTMMTRGGEHAEKDIPARIDEFSKLNPQIEIVYAWPFDTTQVARFLTEHICGLLDNSKLIRHSGTAEAHLRPAKGGQTPAGIQLPIMAGSKSPPYKPSFRPPKADRIQS